MTDQGVVGPNSTPKTYLTLSAVPALLPEDARAASAIERELAAVDRRSADLDERARLILGGALDHLIDYVWYRARLDRCDPHGLTESELRLMDGNR